MLVEENDVRRLITMLKSRRKYNREDRVMIMQIVTHTFSQVEKAMKQGRISDFLLDRINSLLYIIDMADIATKVSALSNPIMSLMNAIMWMTGLSSSCDPDVTRDYETNEGIVPLYRYKRWLLLQGRPINLMESKWQTLQHIYELERERRHLRNAMQYVCAPDSP